MDDRLRAKYPRLGNGHFQITSAESLKYNCVAWAAGQDSRWWAPIEFSCWPEAAQIGWSVKALESVFQLMGYVVASDPRLVPGMEKVAIFAAGDEWTHVARQLESGYWTSKLGQGVDIEHELDGLAGSPYGDVAVIMSRPRSSGPSAPPPLRHLSSDAVPV
jgi:hypothetical protein